MVSWFIRNNFEDIFQSKIQLDSQDFYKHVMEQHGSRQCGMKAIVETLANDKVKKFYEKNKHSALGDAEMLCRLSNSKAMHDRFRSWVICYWSSKRKNRAEEISVCPKTLLSWLNFDLMCRPLKWRTCLMFNVYFRVFIKEDIIWNLQGHSEKGKRDESLNCGTVLPLIIYSKSWDKI